jgi:hypothetical protein
MRLRGVQKDLNSYEVLMVLRSPSMDEAVEAALPEDGEAPLWSDFEDPEGPFEKMAKEKAESAEKHRRWKAQQDKDPEVRNYYGGDNDAEGGLSWGSNQ